MLKAVLTAGALCVVAVGCGSSHPAAAPSKAVTAAPPLPSISWDLLGRRACQSAAKGEDLTAEADAKISKMPELSSLSGYSAVKVWCSTNYHG